MFKSKLQELCFEKSWPLPNYSAIKKGPDHRPSYTASVSVNGSCFDSPTSHGSLKEAHNGAAEAAFTHLTSSCHSRSLTDSALPLPASPNVFSESKDGLKIEVTGKSHSEIFTRTSEDVKFDPLTTEKKTKLKGKAKVGQEENEKWKKSDHPMFPFTIGASSDSPPTAAKDRVSENLAPFSNSNNSATDSAKIAFTALSLEEELPQRNCASYKKSGQKGPTKSKMLRGIKAGNVTDAASSQAGTGEVNATKLETPEMASFLLCNRVRVFSCFPDTAQLPKGVTVVPFSEDMWAAVSLEYSAEKSLMQQPTNDE